MPTLYLGIYKAPFTRLLRFCETRHFPRFEFIKSSLGLLLNRYVALLREILIEPQWKRRHAKAGDEEGLPKTLPAKSS